MYDTDVHRNRLLPNVERVEMWMKLPLHTTTRLDISSVVA